MLESRIRASSGVCRRLDLELELHTGMSAEFTSQHRFVHEFDALEPDRTLLQERPNRQAGSTFAIVNVIASQTYFQIT